MDGPRFERIEETAEEDPRDHLGYARVLGMDSGVFTDLGFREEDILKIIKTNFRLVSIRNHPDIYPNDPVREARMKLAGLAEKVLSDPTSRNDYINRKGEFAEPKGRIIYGVNFKGDRRRAG